MVGCVSLLFFPVCVKVFEVLFDGFCNNFWCCCRCSVRPIDRPLFLGWFFVEEDRPDGPDWFVVGGDFLYSFVDRFVVELFLVFLQCFPARVVLLSTLGEEEFRRVGEEMIVEILVSWVLQYIVQACPPCAGGVALILQS